MGGGRFREVVAHGGSTVYTLDSSRVNSAKATKRVTLFRGTTFLLQRERLIGQLFLLIFHFAS